MSQSHNNSIPAQSNASNRLIEYFDNSARSDSNKPPSGAYDGSKVTQGNPPSTYSTQSPSVTSSQRSSTASSQTLSRAAVKENKYSKIEWPTSKWTKGGLRIGGMGFIGGSTAAGFLCGGLIGAGIGLAGSLLCTGVAYGIKRLIGPSKLCKMADQAVSKHIISPDAIREQPKDKQAGYEHGFASCRDALMLAAKEYTADAKKQGRKPSNEEIQKFLVGCAIQLRDIINPGDLAQIRKHNPSTIQMLKELATEDSDMHMAGKLVLKHIRSQISDSRSDQNIYRFVKRVLCGATHIWMSKQSNRNNRIPNAVEQHQYMSECAQNLAKNVKWDQEWDALKKLNPIPKDVCLRLLGHARSKEEILEKQQELKQVANDFENVIGNGVDLNDSVHGLPAELDSTQTELNESEVDDDASGNVVITRQPKISNEFQTSSNEPSFKGADAAAESAQTVLTKDEETSDPSGHNAASQSNKGVDDETQLAEEPVANTHTNQPAADAQKLGTATRQSVSSENAHVKASVSRMNSFFLSLDLGDNEDYDAGDEKANEAIKDHIEEQLTKSKPIQSAPDNCRGALASFAGRVARQAATNAVNSAHNQTFRNLKRRRGTSNAGVDMNQVKREAGKALNDTLEALRSVNGLQSDKVTQDQVEKLKEDARTNVGGLMYKHDPRHCSTDVLIHYSHNNTPTDQQVASSIARYALAKSIHEQAGMDKLGILPAKHFSDCRREIVQQVVREAEESQRFSMKTWDENAIHGTVKKINDDLLRPMSGTVMHWLADGPDSGGQPGDVNYLDQD